MRAILVHNPTSGSGRVEREGLIAALRDADIEPLYQSSKVGGLTAALAEPTDCIVVAGGDGTVAKVLTQMPDRTVPVAILPIGTANNIASSFGICGGPEEIARRLAGAERRPLDIGFARGPWGRCWFVEGVGLGVLARVAAHFGKSRSPERRLRAARREIRRVLKRAAEDRVRVCLDGEALPDEHLMLEVLNIPCSGPGLLMSSEVDAGDRQLDVVMVEPAQREAMRRWLKNGAGTGAAPVRRWRGCRVTIAWEGSPLHVDDDHPGTDGVPGIVELELAPDPATLLVPAS